MTDGIKIVGLGLPEAEAWNNGGRLNGRSERTGTRRLKRGVLPERRSGRFDNNLLQIRTNDLRLLKSTRDQGRGRLMARTRCPFTQEAVTRALKAAVKAGVEVRIELLMVRSF